MTSSKARQTVTIRTEGGAEVLFTYDGSGECGFWECWACHSGSGGALDDAKGHARQCMR